MFCHLHGALVEFSYVSEAAPDLPASVLLRVAGQAWSFNSRAGITGFLRFADGRFEQVIEGLSDLILPLSSRILTDRRHGSIAITAFRPIAARRYERWSASGVLVTATEPEPSGAAVNLRYLLAPASGEQPAGLPIVARIP